MNAVRTLTVTAYTLFVFAFCGTLFGIFGKTTSKNKEVTAVSHMFVVLIAGKSQSATF